MRFEKTIGRNRRMTCITRRVRTVAVTVVLLVCVLCRYAALRAGAEDEAFNWYCAHVQGHVQPCADGRFSFIRDVGGFYIDSRPEHAAADSTDKVVYLTFDAGYENGNVGKVLDAMTEAGATGAFFVLGNLAQQNPGLLRRMADTGNLVCNHSFSHRDMTSWSAADIAAELTRLEDACREAGVEPARFFRPPEGRFSESLLRAAKEQDYRTIFWSFAYADWDNNHQPSPEAAKAKILNNLHNGAVILLHPTSATNAAILPSVLADMKAQGYRFGTLYELTGVRPPAETEVCPPEEQSDA